MKTEERYRCEGEDYGGCQKDTARAQAAIQEQAALNDLGYARITAPESGRVGERKVLLRQMVSPGTQVISLVQNDVWVQANYKEAQVRHIHPGDPISVRVDFLSGVPFNGKAERPSPASGARFALLLPDNATGNFTKIVQRLSVKIVLDRGQPALERSQDGLSVTATVCTFGGAQ